MKSFSFPPWRQAKPKVESLSDQLAKAMLRGKQILFLDDDSDLGELVDRVAIKYDLQLIQARTSGEARSLLTEGHFDAAILDINVVNGNGLALYQWLKDIYPRLQVIFLTGMDVESISGKIHAIGSAPVYAKPTLWNAGFMEDLFERLGCRKKQQLVT